MAPCSGIKLVYAYALEGKTLLYKHLINAKMAKTCTKLNMVAKKYVIIATVFSKFKYVCVF